MPFRDAPAAQPLTLERYASLCVELERYAAQQPGVLARCRLTASQKTALDEHFRKRFTEHPTDWLAFQRACATYRAWLDAQPKR